MMTPKRADRIKDQIDEAVSQAQADGWSLVPGVTLESKGKEMCPVGAVALQGDPEGTTALGRRLQSGRLSAFVTARRILRITMRESAALARGFDNQDLDDEEMDESFFQLGRSYRP